MCVRGEGEKQVRICTFMFALMFSVAIILNVKFIAIFVTVIRTEIIVPLLAQIFFKFVQYDRSWGGFPLFL